MKCDFCSEEFVESTDGLIQKTMHEIIMHHQVPEKKGRLEDSIFIKDEEN